MHYRHFFIGLFLLPAATALLGAQAQMPPVEAAPAAEVSFLHGRVEAVNPAGDSRKLAEGDSVYAGETLKTGPSGYIDLDFADGGRMFLQPGTIFRIDAFKYTPKQKPATSDTSTPEPPNNNEPDAETATVAQAESNNAFFSLLKGAFRAVSGVIGHANHEAYAVRTPVATIGIRGTEYEARLCQGDCPDAADTPNGLYLAVEQGIVALRNDTGELRIHEREFAYAANRHSRIRRLTKRPRIFDIDSLPDNMDAPRLEKLKKRYKLKRLLKRRALRKRATARRILQQKFKH